MKVLVVNPGSTSTKIAIYNDERKMLEENIRHDAEKLGKCKDIFDELPIRKKSIDMYLKNNNQDISSFDGFAGRGGPLKSLKAGVYKVDQNMVDDVKNGKYQVVHASLLGCVIVNEFSKIAQKPAFIVDAISTDEMAEIAKITGHPNIKMDALTHTLNVRACARVCAERLGLDFFSVNFIVAHLGGGISVNSLEKGRIVDVVEGRQTGPFAPTSCGNLPVRKVVKLIDNNKLKISDIPDLYSRNGGIKAYFGTDDVKELLEKRKENPSIESVLKAMCFQVAKAINAQKTILRGIYEKIIITGGLAYSETVKSWITEWFLNTEQFYYIPGEHEMEALAKGALRALQGNEKILEY